MTGKATESSYSPFVGMDDKAYADFLEERKKGTCHQGPGKEIDEFGAKTRLTASMKAVCYSLYMASSYQAGFLLRGYSGCVCH